MALCLITTLSTYSSAITQTTQNVFSVWIHMTGYEILKFLNRKIKSLFYQKYEDSNASDIL